LPKSGSLGTHFPGGILVDELDLNRWNWAAHQRASQRRQKKPKQPMEIAVKNEEENASGNVKDAYQNVIIWPEKEAGKEEETIKQNEAIELAQEKEDEYSQEPCCSSSVLKNDEAFSKDKEVKGKESHQNAKTIQPGTSELNAAESGLFYNK
jgi:DNA polymerase sigma